MQYSNSCISLLAYHKEVWITMSQPQKCAHWKQTNGKCFVLQSHISFKWYSINFNLTSASKKILNICPMLFKLQLQKTWTGEYCSPDQSEQTCEWRRRWTKESLQPDHINNFSHYYRAIIKNCDKPNMKHSKLRSWFMPRGKTEENNKNYLVRKLVIVPVQITWLYQQDKHLTPMNLFVLSTHQ